MCQQGQFLRYNAGMRPSCCAVLLLLACGWALAACSRDQDDPRPAKTASQDTTSPDWRALHDQWTYPAPVPDFELTDHQGRRFRLGSLRGRYVLLGFIYTRCPVAQACPLTTSKMRAVQDRWHALPASQKSGPGLTLLSITLDPGYDTPERLAAYGRARGADLTRWRFATGPAGLVTEALPSILGILALPRGDGDIQHSVKVALLAPDLTVAREWKDNAFTPDEVIGLVTRAGSPAPP